MSYNIGRRIMTVTLKGGADMATSSIFTSFNIHDSKTAEAFVDALDRSANEPKRTISSPNHITDKDAIAKMFSQRKNAKNE